MNKRGTATVNLFLFIIMAFLIVILLGTFIYTYGLITTELLSTDIQMAGAVNLTEATANTMGMINTAMLNQANIISIIFLFSLVIAMFFVAYITRDESLAVFMVFDILVLIFAYILAVYMSNAYETVLNSVPFQSILITNLSLSTQFILLLPKITVIAGIITMIISYSAIPKTKEEIVGGY